MRFVGRLLDNDTGYLERAFLGGRWVRWPILGTKHGEHGILRWEFPHGKVKLVSLDAMLLSDFLTLEEGSATDIEKYARRWGVLGLCVHNLPIGHPELSLLFDIASAQLPTQRSGGIWFDEVVPAVPGILRMKSCEPVFHLGRRWSESLDAWRWYARTTRRLLESANQLSEAPDPHLAAELQTRMMLWLQLAPMQLACANDGGRLEPRLAPPYPIAALSAVLATQVCFAVTASRSLLHCSACGSVYFPKRKPTTGTGRYCPRCGKRAAWRAASRRSYQKRKERENG